jgi:diguanylate cyclase (GGDEF)-like protein
MSNLSKPVILIIAFFLSLMVAYINYLAGEDMSMAVLYLLPITISIWFGSRPYGIASALFAGALMFGLDFSLHPFYKIGVHAWNIAIYTGFFLSFAYVLAALKGSLEQEKFLSRTDVLTGADNLRSFYYYADYELERSKRYRHIFTTACIAADDFKKINETLGLETGNSLLIKMVDAVQFNIRSFDVFARLGGDEFILLFPETSKDDALLILEKLSSALSAEMLIHKWNVTFSIGAVTFESYPKSVRELIKATDGAMYQAKTTGKNKIVHVLNKATERILA